MVCFVLKGMGENLRKIAMHITNDFVTSAVGTNFKNGVATWCYFDEFHILLRDPLTAGLCPLGPDAERERPAGQPGD